MTAATGPRSRGWMTPLPRRPPAPRVLEQQRHERLALADLAAAHHRHRLVEREGRLLDPLVGLRPRRTGSRPVARKRCITSSQKPGVVQKTSSGSSDAGPQAHLLLELAPGAGLGRLPAVAAAGRQLPDERVHGVAVLPDEDDPAVASTGSAATEPRLAHDLARALDPARLAHLVDVERDHAALVDAPVLAARERTAWSRSWRRMIAAAQERAAARSALEHASRSAGSGPRT